ncbi:MULTISPECIES: phage holin family protein [Bacillales]|uniref:phage holin family protein n=1 Tax=Bacillales TaxID=1385 RepID=UPI0003494014|nr:MULTISPECIES: phage holin family protein [Bacillales]KMZ43997.1 holin [Bacillus sp. FJAT-27238]
MKETDLLALANQYLLDDVLIVVVALLFIGVILKKTPRIADWLIPWLLTVSGIGLAWGVMGAITVQATIQGILAAGIATLGHQLWKQTFDKRKEDAE